MIYLIDDKLERQRRFGWPEVKLEKYSDVIVAVHTNAHLQEIKQQIFAGDNIILFHESFFDAQENLHPKHGIEIRRDIQSYSSKAGNLVVFFSGSIGSRIIDMNSAHIPVHILYRNLGTLCERVRLKDDFLLKAIVFGSLNVKEEILLLKAEIWDSLYDTKDQEMVELNASLFQALEKIGQLTRTTVVREGISIAILKNQLRTL